MRDVGGAHVEGCSFELPKCRIDLLRNGSLLVLVASLISPDARVS